MKRFSLIVLLLMSICTVAKCALPYFLGYYERSYALLFLQFPLVLIGLPLTFCLSLICIIYFFYKQYQLWGAGLSVGLLLFLCLELLLPASNQFLVYGLRDRLKQDYSLDDLRSFAREIHQMSLSGNNSHLDDGSLKKKESEEFDLKKKYPFLSWIKTRYTEGPSFYNDIDGVVNVRWGGALVGHWGFSIADDGGKLDLPQRAGIKVLRLSDDIIVVSEPD